MKVFVDNANRGILSDINKGAPFSFVDVDQTDDPEEASLVFAYLGGSKPHWEFVDRGIYKKFEHKYMFFADYDRPHFAYSTKAIKILSQPLQSPKVNQGHKIIVAPLTMGSIDYEISMDEEFMEYCRNLPKKYNFVFLGSNQQLPCRRFMKNLKLPKFLRQDTEPIWNLSPAEKVAKVRKFLEIVAQAKYGFAPRGVGTSSYRLYQCMMVGTVPLVTGMVDFPFRDKVDWDSFAILGGEVDYARLLETDNYDDRREKCLRFWDDYVFLPNCYRELLSRVRAMATESSMGSI